MKRKSLRLSKETVRSLSSEQLRSAGGAGSWRWWCAAVEESASNCEGLICGPTALCSKGYTYCGTCPADSCACYFFGG
jgi:hypothetical protein